MTPLLAKIAFQAWPFSFGHTSIMSRIKPARPIPFDQVTTKLRGYPLKFTYNPNTYIGQYLYFRGMFEEGIVNTMARLLDEGMTFIDVGGNIGLHTIVAAHKIGPSGKVYTFEPQAMCRKSIILNLKLNNLANTTLLPYALGKEEMEGKIFHINKSNDGQASLRAEVNDTDFEKIEIRTLTSVMELQGVTNADVIKIDIEGAELEMLQGATSFFDTARPRYVFIEVIDHHLNRFGHSSIEIINWFKGRGYTCKVLDKGRWKTLDGIDRINGDFLMELQ